MILSFILLSSLRRKGTIYINALQNKKRNRMKKDKITKMQKTPRNITNPIQISLKAPEVSSFITKTFREITSIMTEKAKHIIAKITNQMLPKVIYRFNLNFVSITDSNLYLQTEHLCSCAFYLTYYCQFGQLLFFISS
ncbi:hypothetical protein TTHERM_000170219 (macronuclear) [Tetrahymena thermophila SB210]|uniref:Uncharacterized protein n=1 Tax=Tetrahymena thermophila (strain SB210) TaxID=312017 RepID=W7XK40_TETTS|nr:hypothetical protein TTHERM_000170219 [Tetrahymena thermophila SB210]EWS76191.1 hypothetical protein TTHERM_000170219 [Tetrahymena thermophila SB210]|eukprot:XP_012651238.1 hypothetical protein TTHERM_000170219 [Tetrahymena thermophila SB210]